MIGYKEIHWAIFAASCITAEDKFVNVLKDIGIQPDTTVEVGTHKGLSTAILASISNTVNTFDVQYQPIAEPIWKLLNIEDRIIYVVVGQTSQKEAAIDIELYLRKHDVHPDFVFIDGPHTHYEDVMLLFKLFVKLGAPRILLDDAADKKFPGTAQVAKEIKAKMFYDRFAYWEG